MVRALRKGKNMAAPESRYRQPKQLEAGRFQQEISSFRLYLAAEGKAPKTVRNPVRRPLDAHSAYRAAIAGASTWNPGEEVVSRRWLPDKEAGQPQEIGASYIPLASRAGSTLSSPRLCPRPCSCASRN